MKSHYEILDGRIFFSNCLVNLADVHLSLASIYNIQPEVDILFGISYVEIIAGIREVWNINTILASLIH